MQRGDSSNPEPSVRWDRQVSLAPASSLNTLRLSLSPSRPVKAPAVCYSVAMKAAGMVTILVAVAALYGCGHNRHRPTIDRATVWIETARYGDPQIQAGLAKDAIYIQTPALCAPNTEGAVFVADAAERSATLVTVQFGQIAGNYVEVRRGLRPGDRVIVSDMSAWTDHPLIDLR